MRCKMQKICQFLKIIFILQVKKKTRHNTLENTTGVQILQFHECVAFYTLQTCLRSSLPSCLPEKGISSEKGSSRAQAEISAFLHLFFYEASFAPFFLCPWFTVASTGGRFADR